MNATPRPPAKQGIALIIVIGLLTVLAILALSFAVTMRTERLAARGFADSFRSREVAQSGLAQAMLAVQTVGANWFYPNWGPECVVSPGGLGTTTNLLMGAASNYVPTSVLGTVAANAIAANWTALRDSNNRLIGRYAYVAVNCSGLLDANLNYGRAIVTNTDRVFGQAPSELYLVNALLPEILDAGAVGLKNERTTGPTLTRTPRRKAWMRADTLMDLGIIGRWGWTGTNPLNTTNPANLFHFSYFPLGFGEGAGTTRTANTNVIYIGGTAATLEAKRTEIANQFAALGINQSEDTARNLIDMVDGDDVPGGVNGGGLTTTGLMPDNCNSFCTEPVPMINEVVVDSTMTPGASGFDCQIRVAVELLFPFVGVTNNYNYVVQVEGRINGGQFSALAPANLQTAAASGPWNPNTYKIAQVTFDTSTTTNVLPTSFEIRELSVRKAANGITVDRVTPTMLPWGSNGYLANFVDGTVRSSWSATDPRFNWKHLLDVAQAPFQWTERDKKSTIPGNATLGNPNTGVGTLGESGSTMMYAGTLLPAGRPLTSIGDLSFLVYDNDDHWTTLKPYDTTGQPGLLNRFTLWPVNPRGIVNLNTANRNVLATVFNYAPIEAYPGQLGASASAAQRLTSADALNVAQAIIANRPATGFPNLSDLSQAKAAIFGALGGLPDDYYREGVLRNSSNLLGVRQNIFTFVVLGQAVKDSFPNGTADGVVQPEEVLGEAKLLVVAWRDPYLVNGRNHWFIRTLQWMDE